MPFNGGLLTKGKSGSRLALIASVASLVLSACAPAPIGSERGEGAQPAATRQSKPVVFIARSEPDERGLGRSGGVGINTTPRFFNATLMMRDGQGTPQAQLAAALPQLNTDTWRLFPDGRMETTYRLRPNLTWHDGTPFTANDLVFAWQVYAQPELGEAGAPPQNLMEEASAPDLLTFVVQWRKPYPSANLLSEDFRPLPRHLLETTFKELRLDVWDNLPFWRQDYVGLGAFRVDGWEPGAFIDGVAFDGYVFGRPKIDRLRVIFMQDPNAVTANLLSGGANLVADITIRFETGVILKGAWAGRGERDGGNVSFTAAQVRYTFFQLRPDYASPRAITDLRVRRAIAHAIDKQALADALHTGEGIPTDIFVPKTAPLVPTMDRAVAKYPSDTRRAQQLMEEAGFARGGDGFYAHPTEGRFEPEWRATAGGDSELQVGVLSDSLRRFGIDTRTFLLPRPFENQTRHTFPTMLNWSTTGQPDEWFTTWTVGKMPTPENRWTGSNGGGWVNPDYERLADAFSTSLDQNQRDQLMVEMGKVLADQVPVLPLYYNLDVVANTGTLRGVHVAPDGSIGWNVQDWEMI
jgi:peptide/nickel transport system substrate-binding protein